MFRATPRPPGSGRISRRLVAVLALGAGVAVANLYYAQPLLPTIAGDFGVSSSTAGLIVTLSQLGYAAGLAFIVPLGDRIDRRRLVPAGFVAVAAALLGAAAAPGVAVLIGLSALIGCGSVMTHVMMPLAAQLAGDEERGRVVGTVMGGLLLGILLGRTAAGLVAEAAGWRAVYVGGSVLMVGLAVVLRRELPAEGPRPGLPYGALLGSVVGLARRVPALRLRCAYGALAFAGFSAFWTSVSFMLSGPPYGYGDAVIGLFALIGAAGAACATVAGRLADAGRTRPATGVFALTMVAAFALLALSRHSQAALIAGILLLDVGGNGLHVLNQGTIYTLTTEARSRVNSVYMTSFFLGGSAGSAASAAVYRASGWGAVCLLGAVLGLAACGLWVWEGRAAAARAVL